MLADVYRVPGLACACTMHSCITREGFGLRVNLQKTRVHGCAHAIRVILNAGTVLVSIKFKSSCTVVGCVSNLFTLASNPCNSSCLAKKILRGTCFDQYML